jgi:hypothetical protein
VYLQILGEKSLKSAKGSKGNKGHYSTLSLL